MFINARKDDLRDISSDVCIIGAGATGIAIARALSQQGFRICLLESGGFEPDPATQSLYTGAITGVPYFPLESTRLRYFGGTTGSWGGAAGRWKITNSKSGTGSRTVAGRFRARSWFPNYIKAQEVCEVGPFNYDAAYWSEEGNQPLLPFVDSRLMSSAYQNSSPATRFGTRYRDDIGKADSVTAVLHANVTRIERDTLTRPYAA